MVVVGLLGCGSDAKDGRGRDMVRVDSGAEVSTAGTATGPTPTGTTMSGTSPTSPTGDTASGDTGTLDTAAVHTGETGATADTGGSGTAAVDCRIGDKPQVVVCSVTLDAPAVVTLELSAPGVPTRRFASAEAAEHEVVGWGLKPLTTYTWTLADASGEVRTGAVPFELADATIEVTGALFDADAVLVYVNCGWFVIVDGDGDIVWAHETDVYDRLTDGMSWSQADRSVLAVTDSTMSPDDSVFSEVHVSGAEVLRLEPETHFTLGLTHDVARWGPYTFLLGQDDARIAGFEVWEGTTHHGTWGFAEAFPDRESPEASHVNGITVTEDGVVVVSERTFDALIAVDGDPVSPTFLDRLWHASGAPGDDDDLADPDYAPASGEIFRSQHHGTYTPDDHLWVFDNYSDGFSRALRMHMDHDTGLLTEDAAWSMGEVCANQGGAVPLDGGVLATCANSRVAKAFREGAEAPAFTLHATCERPERLEGFTRALPVWIE